MPEGYSVEEAKSAIEEVGKTFHDLKDAVAALDEGKADGKSVGELQAKVAKIETALDNADEMKERLDNVEAFVRRGGAGSLGDTDEAKEAEAKYNEAAIRWMRKGDDHAMEQAALEFFGEKALAAQSEADGGYRVPEDMSGRIVQRIYETSPMRQVANIITTSSDRVSGIYDTDETDLSKTGETEAPTAKKTPKIGKWAIDVHEYSCEPAITQRLLDDSSFNFESWLSGKIAQKIMRQQNESYVKGLGGDEATGFLSYANASDEDAYEIGKIGTIETETADSIDFDDMIDFTDLLKDEYMVNARIASNRRNWKLIRKLKGTDGHYLWQPSLQVGDPNTIDGVQLISMNDMPRVDLVNNTGYKGAFAIADWNEAYTIVDRLGIRTLRDNLTLKGYVKYYTIVRGGGGVVNFDAIRRLDIKA